MKTISATDARNGLPELLDRARYQGERVLIEKSGKPAAVLISVEDFQLLEDLEDARDRQLLHEAREDGDGFVSLEEHKANRRAGQPKE